MGVIFIATPTQVVFIKKNQVSNDTFLSTKHILNINGKNKLVKQRDII